MRHAVERLHRSAGRWEDRQPAERRARVGINVDADTVDRVDTTALTVGQGPITTRHAAGDVRVLKRRPRTHASRHSTPEHAVIITSPKYSLHL